MSHLAVYYAVVFLPLLSFVLAGFFGRLLGATVTNVLTVSLLLATATCAGLIFNDIALQGHKITLPLFQWINAGTFEVSWALRFDTLSAVMLVVITWVSAMVHLYSVGYMAHDESRQRFMSYLGLFTFAMLMLVTADNLVQLFFGWEGVGLASYLLIGFWYDRPTANAAAIKAFVVNRVGDFGLALGIFAAFMLFGSVQFDAMFAQVADKAGVQSEFFGYSIHAITLVSLLLFVGAVGKSAQLGLHTWLPDAMEGPTPVSALIHAATMVTAGVFLMCRVSPLLEYAPLARDVITILGAATALFAASIGLTQFDIKRVIAYSTCSQLGYMMFAVGVSAYSAAMFHLFTHAFFKALLFLGAGSVIHAMSDEQDMRRMGGLARLIKVTFVLMFIGSLALAGIPPFAGYFSKDMILEAAYASHSAYAHYAYYVGVVVAYLTAFYSWRVLVLTFHQKSRADHHTLEHVHESPLVMLLPMIFLAVGAVLSGYLGAEYFVGNYRDDFWNGSLMVLAANDSVAHAHHVATWVKLLPLEMALAGIAVAYAIYLLRPNLPTKAAEALKPLYNLLYNKWYVDQLYNVLFVVPAQRLAGFFWKRIDNNVVDRFLPNGAAHAADRTGGILSTLQTGFVYHYGLIMLGGVVLLLSWFMLQSLMMVGF